MTPDQVVLVQSTWKAVAPHQATVASLFYGRLFELDPALRPLFRGDIVEQGAKLTKMIDAAVTGLQDLDALVPAVEALGQRHVGYGVEDHHYDTVAAALLWTLDKGLGAAFTPAVKQAWTETYLILAGVMKKSAAGSAA